ncbi:hypothetical protein [Nitrosopumilus sp.]|uniref:hypothetical protein n=1 Tax=Nitrosopumilus sp. TaxID=2024843 RepID=UPI003D0E02D9
MDSINFSDQSQIIISLDFPSHEKLESKNIRHIISDNFISDDEIKKLQISSYEFVRWYENNIIKNLITYKNINLGELFYLDFYIYLLPILKFFSEFQHIVSKYPNSTFFASSKISNFLKHFSVNYKEIGENDNDVEFYLDNIDYEFRLFKKDISFSISKSNYKLLKNFSENFSKLLLNKSHDPSKKSHVLIEFDPIKSEKLFSILPKTSNFVIYNRRRPYFWNSSSFSILKKSNICFFRENELSDNELKNNLQDADMWVLSTIEKLKSYDDYFFNFFKTNNRSFWKIIEKHFFHLCKLRFSILVYEIELALNFFKITNPSTVTLWSELGTIEQIFINVAQSQNIPVILVQHGYYHDDETALTYNYFSGVLPKKSDYFLVWGNKMYDYCIDTNLKNKNIKIIGNLFFDNNKLKSNIQSSDYILLATQSPTDVFLSDLNVSTYENYINAIIKICEISKKLNKKLIIKLHPDPHELDITKYIESFNSHVQIIKSGNIKELIQNSSLFLCIDISTTILEAQFFKKPVIAVSVKDYNLGDSKSKIFQSCVYVNTDNLETQMIKIFNDPKFKNKIISKGSEFVNDYSSNQDSAAKNFVNFLNNF